MTTFVLVMMTVLVTLDHYYFKEKITCLEMEIMDLKGRLERMEKS